MPKIRSEPQITAEMIAAARTDMAKHNLHFLRNFPGEKPERLAIAVAAINALDTHAHQDQISLLELEPIVTAASSPYKCASEVGSGILFGLLRVQKAYAKEAVLAMSQSSNWRARWHALIHLHQGHPIDLCREIITKGLDDKSSKVRTFAVQKVFDFQFTDLLTRLELMLKSESHNEVRETLQLLVPIMRDGYFLELSEDGKTYHIWTGDVRGLSGWSFPVERYSEEYVENILEQQRRTGYFDHPIRY